MSYVVSLPIVLKMKDGSYQSLSPGDKLPVEFADMIKSIPKLVRARQIVYMPDDGKQATPPQEEKKEELSPEVEVKADEVPTKKQRSYVK